ncbi:hypothetical protein HK405_000900, partial [Cladochytrium tenue]
MAGRQPYKLKYVTAAHNMVLCIWSLGMFVAGFVAVARRAITMGVDEVFCTTALESVQGPLLHVIYIYYLSKFYELLDTVILVLKK